MFDMSTEVQSDPYTLVAHHLQEGEATRAELKALTDLDYAQIEAALHRFVEVNECVSVREDGSGIEHYRWKNGAPLPEPSNGARAAIRAMPVEAGELPRRPAGWSLTAEIRKLIEGFPYGSEITMRLLYDRLIMDHPQAADSYTAFDLKTQISAILISLKGKLIVRSGTLPTSNTAVYQKMRMADLTCVDCGAQRSLGSAERCRDCYQKRASEKEALKVSARRTDRQTPLSKSGQDVDKTRTTEPTESKQPQELQVVQPDNSLDNVASLIPLSEAADILGLDVSTIRKRAGGTEGLTLIPQGKKLFLIRDEVMAHKAKIINTARQPTSRAIYALPAFITDLRAERDELDLLIGLLEKRMLRGGGVQT